MTPEQGAANIGVMAAVVLLRLKAECEAQHARAERAEAELATLRADLAHYTHCAEGPDAPGACERCQAIKEGHNPLDVVVSTKGEQ